MGLSSNREKGSSGAAVASSAFVGDEHIAGDVEVIAGAGFQGEQEQEGGSSGVLVVRHSQTFRTNRIRRVMHSTFCAQKRYN